MTGHKYAHAKGYEDTLYGQMRAVNRAVRNLGADIVNAHRALRWHERFLVALTAVFVAAIFAALVVSVI